MSKIIDTILKHGHEPLLDRVLLSEEQLQTRIAELGAQISRDYRGKDLLLVSVLKGGVVFLTDLMRCVDVAHSIDFMAVSSYGVGARATRGQPRITLDLNTDIRGRHVLLVEDIIDSGLTLNYLLKNLAARNPASLAVCALLLKEGQQKVEPDLAYVGFRIANTFIVGYGLDVAERYRNLRDIRTFVGSDGGASQS